jgi:hypothetical protein
MSTTTKNSINKEFITNFTEILGGDNFFLSDLIDQEDLFSMQDQLAKLIADYANNGSSTANQMVKLLPNTFEPL